MNTIIDRIKKLLNLGKHNTDICEAEAAISKAHELIARHGISEALLQIENKEEKKEAPIEKDYVYNSKRVPTWLANLVTTIGAVNNCIVFISPRFGIACVGERNDIELVSMLGSYLYEEITIACKNSCKRNGYNKSQGRIFANSFKLGATRTLCDRFREANRKVKEEYKGSYALVVIANKMTRVKQSPYASNLKTMQTSASRIDSFGYVAGQMAGQSMNLNPNKRIT